MFKNRKDGRRKTRICRVNASLVTPGKYLSHSLSCSVYTQDYLKMKLKEEFRFNQAQFPRSKGLFREQQPVIEPASSLLFSATFMSVLCPGLLSSALT